MSISASLKGLGTLLTNSDRLFMKPQCLNLFQLRTSPPSPSLPSSSFSFPAYHFFIACSLILFFTSIGCFCGTPFSWNHRIVWVERDSLKVIWSNSPAMHRDTYCLIEVLKMWFSLTLSVSRDGASTTSLVNLFLHTTCVFFSSSLLPPTLPYLKIKVLVAMG